MSLWVNCLVMTCLAVVLVQGRAAPKPDAAENLWGVSRGNVGADGYPRRTMMLTGYYRPVRRTANEGQLTGVFAQGNAVSGGSYLGDNQPEYEHRSDDESPVISSSEAEAAPRPYEHHHQEEDQKYIPHREENQNNDESSDPNVTLNKEVQDGEASNPELPSEVVPHDVNQGEQETKLQRRPNSSSGPKKSKKRPSYEEESDESDDEDDDDDDQSDHPVPFIPFKSNRRRNNIPNLNNFFPMVFTYPRSVAATRNGNSETEGLPGMITAIANSYSTSKGGMASSVATAYGASPSQGNKKRRAQPVQQ